MNRKRFLRLLGLGAVATVITPKMLAEKPQDDFCKRITEIKISPYGFWAGSNDINSAPFVITRNGVLKANKIL